ncbi:putative F-box/FBD/LRR-repeat protein At3g49480 [Argentina anserina]|uniref:putative F-box/FBD/LRR-repeat protein At3g49480 n=1 Tax=Argentina anserina TaxID=57926 RepID=UPI0021763895|nr:putative F-box/FBD/LRR-repeat protein At3g49480 [Potentilla anserina]
MTTVLSRRWNNQWTSIQKLKFYERVDYFRTAHSHSDRISLDSHIVDWMCTVVRCNMIAIALRLEYNGEPIQMPRTVFTCKTLQSLSLHFIGGHITFDAPTSYCFPSLKSLKVSVTDPVEHETEKIFSSCPKLVYLRIHSSASLFSVIAAFNLKPNLVLDNTKSLLVRASILFEINDNLVEERQASLPNLPNMLLLAQISEVKDLYLTAPLLMDCCLPAFGYLTKLELVLYGCDYWKCPSAVLQKAPNLEYLFFFRDKTEGDNECLCDLPAVVPICLSSHLKNIFIWGFKGRKCDIKVADYMLKNSYHLNTFTIIYYNTGALDKKELHKELHNKHKLLSTFRYHISVY